jgi:uncharacterized protein involved in oxidation of intracellular sulfur
MKILFVINDAPYGSEKAYNAMRLAISLYNEHESVEVYIFLMGDAVTCALPSQSTPQGYYNIERMIKAIVNKRGQVKTCGTCADARGIKKLDMIQDVEISTMSQLAKWTVESDKILTF